MTSKRKAELQRKLSMAPLPKPPDGLADRIKRDIPNDLGMNMARERERFSRFSAMSLRVAASVIVLIGGAFLGIRLLSEMQTKNQPPASVVSEPAPKPAVMASRADVEKSESNAVAVASAPVATQKVNINRQEKGRAFGGVVGGTVGSATAGVKTEAAPVVAQAAESKDDAKTITAEAPVTVAYGTERDALRDKEAAEDRATTTTMAPAAAAPPPPAAKMAKSAPFVEAITVTRSELFGISVDRQAFERIKFAIEHGERPAASSVDVEALINYFAGAPDRVRRDAALDLEASLRPVHDGSSTALVRVTVDTAAAIHDATLEIEFDPTAVSAHHRIGGDDVDTASESIMQPSQSVTALYEVTLRPNVRPHQSVATAKLTYVSAGGSEQMLNRWVSYNEAIGAWKNRTRRHRLATLGAIWGETLRASGSGADVALKAEELSKQEPKDEKAKELATLASASSRLRSSSPTGSGR